MDEKGKMNTKEYEELIKEVKANSPYKRLSSAKKKWMSVSEMGELLGLKKTDRYWLVHKNFLRPKRLPERCGSILRVLKSGMRIRLNIIKSTEKNRERN